MKNKLYQVQCHVLYFEELQCSFDVPLQPLYKQHNHEMNEIFTMPMTLKILLTKQNRKYEMPHA